MNTKEIVVIKKFNIYHQIVCSKKEFLVLDAYARIRRSKNELEKKTNKL